MESLLITVGVVVLLVQVALIALVLWLSYRLVVVAVRTAILEADEERARRATGATRAI